MDEMTLRSICDGVMQKWRADIERETRETLLYTNEQNALKAIEEQLGEKSRSLLNTYALTVEDRMDYVHYNLSVKLLNLGVKIGMDLQKAF